MSVGSNDASRAAAPDAASLLARAAAADARADARLAHAIDDFFLAEDDRLDDRTRAAMAASVADTIAAIEREILGHAGRPLPARDPNPAAAASTLPRLIDSGLLRDRALMAEWIGQVRQALLGEALVNNRAPGTAGTLIARLAECRDGVVAQAATAYLLADSRRRSGADALRAELPAELHHRLVWWIAAALREGHAADGSTQVTIDRALAEAALRSLAGHDEGERLDVVAMRLAAAIDARTQELPELLTDALDEGRAALFIAVVAQAQEIDFVEARALVLDPEGDRLWLALRARGLDRATIARIGLALADADHRRDLERFADELDTIAAVPIDAARAALAPLALHRDFRSAVRALTRSARR